MGWYNIFKQHKACKKEISKELVLVAWHPIRWCSWYILDEEKKIAPFLIDEK